MFIEECLPVEAFSGHSKSGEKNEMLSGLVLKRLMAHSEPDKNHIRKNVFASVMQNNKVRSVPTGKEDSK